MINLEGAKSGLLTVETYLGKNKWRCLCECGIIKIIRTDHLKEQRVKSCGCSSAALYAESRQTHGMTNHPAYTNWYHMMSRCTNPKNDRFADYGGRGITVTERWKDVTNFIADMGEKPSPDHSIDRIDNNGNYEPGNCRWATSSEQASNTSKTRKVTFEGRTQSIAQWAKERGIKEATLYYRIVRYGWPIEKAMVATQLA